VWGMLLAVAASGCTGSNDDAGDAAAGEQAAEDGKGDSTETKPSLDAGDTPPATNSSTPGDPVPTLTSSVPPTETSPTATASMDPSGDSGAASNVPSGTTTEGCARCDDTEQGDADAPVPQTQDPTQPGPVASDAGEPSADTGNYERVVLGCQGTPLVLGAAEDAETASVQLVHRNDDFAVGWAASDGYHIQITDGASTSNSILLDAMPAEADPQLFWTGSELRLFYALGDEVYVDTLVESGPLEVWDTQHVVTVAGFRAVQIAPDNFAVLGSTGLYLDDTWKDASLYGLGAVGWDGEYFLYSNVLGHGLWTTYGLSVDGSPYNSALSVDWFGNGGTGRSAGSAFASSAETGRHAVVIATEGRLLLALEGQPLVERELLKPYADVSMLWDGKRYIVLVADGPTEEGAANRDVQALVFTADGALVGEDSPLTTVSDHSADERFPIGGFDGDDYVFTWLRGQEVVVQSCAITLR
jgi:hypothetical protein